MLDNHVETRHENNCQNCQHCPDREERQVHLGSEFLGFIQLGTCQVKSRESGKAINLCNLKKTDLMSLAMKIPVTSFSNAHLLYPPHQPRCWQGPKMDLQGYPFQTTRPQNHLLGAVPVNNLDIYNISYTIYNI